AEKRKRLITIAQAPRRLKCVCRATVTVVVPLEWWYLAGGVLRERGRAALDLAGKQSAGVAELVCLGKIRSFVVLVVAWVPLEWVAVKWCRKQ
ncbi:MAG TPA: hypothetical protein DEV72_03475, partial [Ktedonobacter sp.]|nr:hypothetical protein [Ktedonobacter sp.]